MVYIEYENLPEFCSSYQNIGHSLSSCKKNACSGMQQKVIEPHGKSVAFEKHTVRTIPKYVPKQMIDKGKEKIAHSNEIDCNINGEGTSIPVVDNTDREHYVVEDEDVNRADLVGVNNVPIPPQDLEIMQNPILGFISTTEVANNNLVTMHKEYVQGNSMVNIDVEEALHKVFSASSSSSVQEVQDSLVRNSDDVQITPVQSVQVVQDSLDS